MNRRIVFANRKGGCGKTTTSVNVAAALAHMGSRVLLVDTDPQAHATMSFGISTRDGGPGLADLIRGSATVESTLRHSYIPKLHVLPASRKLADLEREYSHTGDARFWLRDRLDPLRSRFDVFVFDTPPTTDLLTISAMISAEEIYVPTQAHFLAMEGLLEILDLADEIARRDNPALAVLGVIPTFYQVGAPFSEEILTELRQRMGAEAVLTPVRHNLILAEAPGLGRTIFQHDLRSEAAHDYYRVALQISNTNAEAG